MRRIKCVLDGPWGSGKSHLISAFTEGIQTPQDPTDPMFGNKEIFLEEEHIGLDLCERSTSGYQRLAPLVHPNSQVYLLCISIVDFSNGHHEYLVGRCLAEIHHYAPNIPIVLVGTKLDLVEDEVTLDRLRAKHRAPLDRLQGEALAAKLGLVRYFECSAVTLEGVREVFMESAKIATTGEQTMLRNGRKDRILRLLRLSRP
ncbi:P-loop containing nucleoside triphosphate hydrolase protein [Flagelloscypha sp. PMI_526]|nr:P-loop containing nucleoside triphosphate hydrolase protein [Flagelloscypha sp. PMI_526]